MGGRAARCGPWRTRAAEGREQQEQGEYGRDGQGAAAGDGPDGTKGSTDRAVRAVAQPLPFMDTARYSAASPHRSGVLDARGTGRLPRGLMAVVRCWGRLCAGQQQGLPCASR